MAALRLAALSLAGHPDLERFVAEFSGSDRTVAEYLGPGVRRHHTPDRQYRLRMAIASLDLLSARLRGHFDA